VVPSRFRDERAFRNESTAADRHGVANRLLHDWTGLESRSEDRVNRIGLVARAIVLFARWPEEPMAAQESP